MSFAWHDAVGAAGVAAVLGAYFLLQSGRLQQTSLAYSLANGLGAAMVLVSLAVDFNLSAFVVEAAWVLISLYGVVRWALSRRRAG